MWVRVARLCCWKSEHTKETCQDRLLDAPAAGLFAVADGASTTTFPRLWAETLVKHFVAVPLMSDDPFEVDWWVRGAQQHYEDARPKLAALSALAREKEQTKGSESTLATIRFSHLNKTTATTEMLVFGDSCVFIGHPDTRQVESFPLETADDFARAPICIPSNPGVFQRNFHRCKRKQALLPTGVVVMLATDAVAKWLISAGSGQYASLWEAFQEILSQTPEQWGAFIEKLRQNQAIVDDDSTVLILQLQAEGFDHLPASSSSDISIAELGTTIAHSAEIVKERMRLFDQARSDEQRELEAVYYGDGSDVRPLLESEITQDEIKRARLIADALRSVISAANAHYNKPDFVARMREVWEQYKDLLQDQRCAEGIRKTLEANHVFDEPSAAPIPERRQEASPVLPPEIPLPNSARVFASAPPEREAGQVGFYARQQQADTERLPQSEVVYFLPEQGLKPLDTFQAALNTRRIDQVAYAFQHVKQLGALNSMTPDQIALGNFAARLMEAFAQDNRAVLARAYAELAGPPYWQFELTAEELARMRQAQAESQSTPDFSTKLASVNGQFITAALLNRAKSARRYYLEYWIGQFKQKLALAPENAARVRERLEDRRTELHDPQRLQQATLEELIDDVLIQEALELELRDGGLRHFGLNPELQDIYQATQQRWGPGGFAEYLSSQQMTTDDFWYILAVFVRRRKFASYLRGKPNPESFTAWLEAHRARAAIVFYDSSAARSGQERRGWR